MKIFKKLIVLLLLINSSTTFSQIRFEAGYWMPKTYIAGVEKNVSGRTGENSLKPITAILIRSNKIFIKTYKDEFKQSGFKNINKNEIYLKSVMVPLAVNGSIIADPISNKYASDQYYLYRKAKNSMFLIVKDKSKQSDTIQFTKYINDTPIISDDVVRFQIKLVGKYCLYSPALKELEKFIVINKDGNINNSTIINAILLKNVPNLYTGINDFYVLSELKLRNLKKEKVILKFNDSKNIFIYHANQDHLGKLIYIVKRV